MGSHRLSQPGGGQSQECPRTQPQQERQPHPVDAGPQALDAAAGTEEAGRCRRRRVGQEDE